MTEFTRPPQPWVLSPVLLEYLRSCPARSVRVHFAPEEAEEPQDE